MMNVVNNNLAVQDNPAAQLDSAVQIASSVPASQGSGFSDQAQEVIRYVFTSIAFSGSSSLVASVVSTSHLPPVLPFAIAVGVIYIAIISVQYCLAQRRHNAAKLKEFKSDLDKAFPLQNDNSKKDMNLKALRSEMEKAYLAKENTLTLSRSMLSSTSGAEIAKGSELSNFLKKVSSLSVTHGVLEDGTTNKSFLLEVVRHPIVKAGGEGMCLALKKLQESSLEDQIARAYKDGETDLRITGSNRDLDQIKDPELMDFLRTINSLCFRDVELDDSSSLENQALKLASSKAVQSMTKLTRLTLISKPEEGKKEQKFKIHFPHTGQSGK